MNLLDRRLFFPVLLAGIALPALADDPPKDGGEVTISPLWKAGDIHRFDMVKWKTRTAPGKKPVGEARIVLPITATVVEAGEKGFLVRWVQGESRYDDPSRKLKPDEAEIARVFKDFVLEIELDAEATLTGLRNWRDVQKAGEKVADLFAAKQKASGMAQDKIDLVRKFALDRQRTKEQVETNTFKDPMLFFLPIGRTLTVGKAVEYDDELPNTFGGPPFPSKGRFLLTAVDPEKGTATVEWTQTIDPEKGQDALLATIRVVAEKLGKKETDEELKKIFHSLRIDDRAKFTVDLKTGWTTEAEHLRKVNLSGQVDETFVSFRPRADR